MKITLVGINARYTHSCLALFYVRNELALYCSAEIALKQYTINDPYYQLLLQISGEPSDYYFFSAAIWNSDMVTRLVRDLLKIQQQVICVVGGPQAEVVARDVADIRCISVLGEIERVDKKFFYDLEKKSLQEKYRCKAQHRAFSNPYNLSDLRVHLQNRHIYYETSRGCPFSCSYCLSSVNKGVYHKDLNMVRRELELILGENPKEVRFVDRTFNDNLPRALAIWEFLLKQECQTTFHFEISPDRFSEEMFLFLKDLPPNKFEFEIGIQSTNQKTLDAIGRPVDTHLAHQTISRLAEFGTIHLHVDLILGLPYETEETYLESFRNVFAMEPHYIQMGLLKILPGTPICHEAERLEYEYSDSIPYPVLANRWMDPARMQRLYWFGECVERFLNNRYFVSLWRYLRRDSTDIVEFFLSLLAECEKRDFFQRAPTQQLLGEILAECISDRDDADFILQLLRYDWLRCGHKFLPEKLGVNEEASSRNVKKKIFGSLPKDEPSFLTGAEKSYCFKKGYFLEFSKPVLKEVGYEVDNRRHYLCFLPDREESLYRHCRTIVFSLECSE